MKQSIAIACAFLAAFTQLGSPAPAQDSTSIGGCLPGDAVLPWDDAFSGIFGSEQSNTYVVDMTPFLSSWGFDFGVAPLAKTSKSSSQFFNSLMGSQGISSDVLAAGKFDQTSYAVWQGTGYGINNDTSLNSPGVPIDATLLRGPQFAAGFREFGTTYSGFSYSSVVTSIVNIDPSDTSRLYVHRVLAASNTCDGNSEMGFIGFGSVDATGNTVLRADDYPAPPGPPGGCSDVPIIGNNIWLVDAANRNFAIQNVISGTGSLLDPATIWIIQANATTHATPCVMPESVNGGLPMYLGTDFNTQYVRAYDSTSVVTDASHLPAGITATRGNLSYTARNSPLLSSTRGMCATLARAGSLTDSIVVFGVGTNGNVTGSLAATLPSTIVDNATSFTNLGPGTNAFDHYHSQVPFQGGNGNVAVGVDGLGNVLAAAEVDHPSDLGANHGGNYIAVARISATGTSWTMAGYNDNVAAGKPILNGPSTLGGIAIGQMVPISLVGGGGTLGPSVSAPTIDSAGNVWFLSAIELFGAGTPYTIGLLRAVYDPVAFSYELELILKLGDVLAGQNSQRNYMLTDFRIADSNSVDSATMWSGNMTSEAFLGYDPSNFTPKDPRSLGGVVLQGRILYDVDQDLIFDDNCSTTFSLDEEYRVLLYVGSIADSGYQAHGNSCPGTGGHHPVLYMDGFPAAGKSVSLTIEEGLGGQQALLLFGLFQGSFPFGINGCALNITPVIGPQVFLPLSGTGAGNGSITLTAPIPASTPPVTFTMQAFCGDPGAPEGYTSTRGLQVTIFP